MNARLSEAKAQPRFYALLLSLFAAMALALAAAGLYGVLSQSVASQTRAIGVRRALGARRGSVLALVLGEGLCMVGTGLAAGLVAAALSAELLAHLLFGLTPLDPLAYGAAILLLLAVAALACYLPARRAVRLSPVEALRSE